MSINNFDISRGGWLATGIVAALGAYLSGEMDLIQTFPAVWPLIAVAFLRKGVADKP